MSHGIGSLDFSGFGRRRRLEGVGVRVVICKSIGQLLTHFIMLGFSSDLANLFTNERLVLVGYL